MFFLFSNTTGREFGKTYPKCFVVDYNITDNGSAISSSVCDLFDNII